MNKRVLIVGFHKSGTTALTYGVAKGLETTNIVFEPKGRNSLVSLDVHKKTADTSPLIVKALWYPELINSLSEIQKMYDRNIWIVRDPRDNLISQFFWFWTGVRTREMFMRSYDLLTAKEASPHSVPFLSLFAVSPAPAEWYGKLVNQISRLNENWFILKYEDYLNDNIQKLNEYLGFEVKVGAEVDPQFNGVARSKTSDNWRSWFTSEDVQLLREPLSPLLEQLGYDPDDWELDSPRSLPSNVGSAYMLKKYAKRNSIEGIKTVP